MVQSDNQDLDKIQRRLQNTLKIRRNKGISFWKNVLWVINIWHLSGFSSCWNIFFSMLSVQDFILLIAALFRPVFFQSHPFGIRQNYKREFKNIGLNTASNHFSSRLGAARSKEGWESLISVDGFSRERENLFHYFMRLPMIHFRFSRRVPVYRLCDARAICTTGTGYYMRHYGIL